MGLPEYMAEAAWTEAYWEHLAKYGRRKRFWRSGWDHWSLGLSSDEMNRRTLVIGPFVIALWDCRCKDCKADEQHLLDILDAPVDPEPREPVTLDDTHYTTEGWHPADECSPDCPYWPKGGDG